MKKITCKQLGGACEQAFLGDSFEDVARQSRQHAMDMFAKNDADHINAAETMKSLLANPTAMEEWMSERETYFNNLPDVLEVSTLPLCLGLVRTFWSDRNNDFLESFH